MVVSGGFNKGRAADPFLRLTIDAFPHSREFEDSVVQCFPALSCTLAAARRSCAADVVP